MTDTQTVSDKDYSPLWFLQLGTNKLKTVKVNWGGECGCKFTPLHRSIYTYFGHIYFDDCSWYIINNNYYQNEITCSGSFNGCNTCRLELQGRCNLPKLGEQIPIRYNCQEKAGSVIPFNGPKRKSPQSLLRCESVFSKIPMFSLSHLLCMVKYPRS